MIIKLCQWALAQMAPPSFVRARWKVGVVGIFNWCVPLNWHKAQSLSFELPNRMVLFLTVLGYSVTHSYLNHSLSRTQMDLECSSWWYINMLDFYLELFIKKWSTIVITEHTTNGAFQLRNFWSIIHMYEVHRGIIYFLF